MHRSDVRRNMIALDFPRLLLATLFTVALTSSVSAQRVDDSVLCDKPIASRSSANNLKFEYQLVRTARSPKNSEHHTEPVQNATKQNFSTESNSSAIVDSPDAINDKKGLEGEAEGGAIPISFSTSQHKNTVTENTVAIESDKSNKSRTRENVPKERYANPSIVPRKGVPETKPEPRKIQARKGVDQDVDSDILNHTISEYTKSVETSSVTEAAHTNNQTEIVSTVSKLDASNSRSNNSLDYNINSNRSSNATLASTNTTTFHNSSVIHNATTTTPKTSSHIPKPKPTVTTADGPEVNESRPSLRTKSSSLGMPRKIDYIAPVIITIIALPILGAAIFMLYRRGRDCWDKRHYRRMDFLIDGMYND